MEPDTRAAEIGRAASPAPGSGSWAKTPEEGAGTSAGGGSGEAPGLDVTDRVDQGGLPGYLEVERRLAGTLREDEFQEPKYCWLDVPENLDRLFFQLGASGTGGPSESERHASAVAGGRQW